MFSIVINWFQTFSTNELSSMVVDYRKCGFVNIDHRKVTRAARSVGVRTWVQAGSPTCATCR